MISTLIVILYSLIHFTFAIICTIDAIKKEEAYSIPCTISSMFNFAKDTFKTNGVLSCLVGILVYLIIFPTFFFYNNITIPLYDLYKDLKRLVPRKEHEC